jgi:signal peptidase I
MISPVLHRPSYSTTNANSALNLVLSVMVLIQTIVLGVGKIKSCSMENANKTVIRDFIKLKKNANHAMTTVWNAVGAQRIAEAVKAE